MCAIYTGIPKDFRAPRLETPVDCLRKCLGDIDEFPGESLGGAWPNPGGVFRRLFWGVFGKALESEGVVLGHILGAL